MKYEECWNAKYAQAKEKKGHTEMQTMHRICRSNEINNKFIFE